MMQYGSIDKRILKLVCCLRCKYLQQWKKNNVFDETDTYRDQEHCWQIAIWSSKLNNTCSQTVTEDTLWLNTMKVKLSCMDSLSSKKKRPMGGAVEEEMSSVSSTPDVTNSNSYTRWQRRVTQISLALERDIPHSTVLLFFLFTSIKVSITLMSGPPGDISRGRQVQSKGGPAAALCLLTNHCCSNKPKHCGRLHSDIGSLIFTWYPNRTALNALCVTNPYGCNKWNLLT